jgi:hypothetical protein
MVEESSLFYLKTIYGQDQIIINELLAEPLQKIYMMQKGANATTLRNVEDMTLISYFFFRTASV